jgi:threonine dehydrogenase-like Zn-dependent dehydrogenase
LQGCELHLLGRHPTNLNLVNFRGVITHLADRFKETDFDLVVEASGSPGGWETAVQAVRPQGTIVLKSTYHQDLAFNPSNLVVREVTVVGSRCGPFTPALRLLARRLVNPRRLISRIYPLTKALEAFDYARQKGVLKVLLEVSSHHV